MCGSHRTVESRHAGWSGFGWQVPHEAGSRPLGAPLGFEFASDDYDGLLTPLAQRLVASVVTTRASGRIWRKTEQQIVIRI